jgi:hypothetical protein
MSFSHLYVATRAAKKPQFEPTDGKKKSLIANPIEVLRGRVAAHNARFRPWLAVNLSCQKG